MIRRESAEASVPVPAHRIYRRDTATWVAFMALFAFGLLNAVLGPALPYLRRTEHISYVVVSLHQVAFAVGGMTAGLFAIRSNAPRRRTISSGLVCAALAGLILGFGRILPATILAALLISAFGTAALIRVWALLADLHPAHRAVAMTEGEVAVSLAGILTPVLVSACAATWLSWRFAFVIVAAIVLAAGLTTGMTRLPQPPPAPDATKAPAAVGPASSGRTPGRPLITILAVVGLEFSLSFWAASYLHDDVGIARNTSVALVSALYAANLVGRLAASRLARRLVAVTVLRISLAVAFVGVPLLLAAGDAAIAGLGLVVTGIGIGGTFPLASAIHVAAGRRPSDQALGQILAVAGIGQILGPLVAGAVAEAVGLRAGLLVLPALVLVAAATTDGRGGEIGRNRPAIRGDDGSHVGRAG